MRFSKVDPVTGHRVTDSIQRIVPPVKNKRDLGSMIDYAFPEEISVRSEVIKPYLSVAVERSS